MKLQRGLIALKGGVRFAEFVLVACTAHQIDEVWRPMVAIFSLTPVDMYSFWLGGYRMASGIIEASGARRRQRKA